jgi:hypothetical protein
MANALDNEKRHQILTLGRLRWPLRRIQVETGVRRDAFAAAQSQWVELRTIDHVPENERYGPEIHDHLFAIRDVRNQPLMAPPLGME